MVGSCFQLRFHYLHKGSFMTLLSFVRAVALTVMERYEDIAFSLAFICASLWLVRCFCGAVYTLHVGGVL